MLKKAMILTIAGGGLALLIHQLPEASPNDFIRYAGENQGNHIVHVIHANHRGNFGDAVLTFGPGGEFISMNDLSYSDGISYGDKLIDIVRNTDFPANVELSGMNQYAVGVYDSLQSNQHY
ncbi:MAG: hypothetical protein V1743_01355 [Nanoarchaeota archaeon]